LRTVCATSEGLLKLDGGSQLVVLRVVFRQRIIQVEGICLVCYDVHAFKDEVHSNSSPDRLLALTVENLKRLLLGLFSTKSLPLSVEVEVWWFVVTGLLVLLLLRGGIRLPPVILKPAVLLAFRLLHLAPFEIAILFCLLGVQLVRPCRS
jgi:hypothetical protein